jgi:hypothetical protein
MAVRDIIFSAGHDPISQSLNFKTNGLLRAHARSVPPTRPRSSRVKRLEGSPDGKGACQGLVQHERTREPKVAPPAQPSYCSDPTSARPAMVDNTVHSTTSNGDCDRAAYLASPAMAPAQSGCHHNSTVVSKSTRMIIVDGVPARPAPRKRHAEIKRTDRFLRTKGNKIFRKCFRCLTIDHLVKDCRDPIKCTSCLRSGHKSY